MKYKFLSLGVLSLGLLCSCTNYNSNFVNGDVEMGESMTINGSANIRGKKCNTLTVNGAATITDVTVIKNVTINGSANLEDSRIGSITVSGSADLKNVDIKALAIISGSGNFTNCTLNDLQLQGTQFDFTSTQVNGDIHLLSNKGGIWSSNNPKVQTITLKDTTVAGNIVFDDKKGIVKLEGKSKIKGKVIGGKIV